MSRRKNSPPTYLFTRSGIYYFRYALPRQAAELVGRREIRISLKTRKFSEAIPISTCFHTFANSTIVIRDQKGEMQSMTMPGPEGLRKMLEIFKLAFLRNCEYARIQGFPYTDEEAERRRLQMVIAVQAEANARQHGTAEHVAEDLRKVFGPDLEVPARGSIGWYRLADGVARARGEAASVMARRYAGDFSDDRLFDETYPVVGDAATATGANPTFTGTPLSVACSPDLQPPMTSPTTTVLDNPDTGTLQEGPASDKSEYVPALPARAGRESDALPTLGAAAEDYLAIKQKARKGRKGWSPTTARQEFAKIRVFCELVGEDLRIDQLSHADMRYFTMSLLQMPANAKKYYPTLTAAEVLDMPFPKRAKKFDPNTFNNYTSKVKTFLGWLRNQYPEDLAQGLEGILMETLPQRTGAMKHVFSERELGKIFDGDNYLQMTRKKACHFWAPLIAAHSGLRLEEICQLHLDDVNRYGKKRIWCFDVNDDEEKKVKNDAARRHVPVHPTLIRLGLLRYVKRQRDAGETRLFPELAYSEAAGNYSHGVSKWFARRCDDLGFPPRKRFHALRGTFLTECKNSNVQCTMAQEIAGHKNSKANLTYFWYAGDYLPEVLMDQVMKKVDVPAVDVDSLSKSPFACGERVKPEPDKEMAA